MRKRFSGIFLFLNLSRSGRGHLHNWSRFERRLTLEFAFRDELLGSSAKLSLSFVVLFVLAV
jgi:hypothetical protein